MLIYFLVDPVVLKEDVMSIYIRVSYAIMSCFCDFTVLDAFLSIFCTFSCSK